MSTVSASDGLGLITRTEYAEAPVQVRRMIGVSLLLGAPILLVALVLAGVSPQIVTLIAGGSVTGALAVMVFGSTVRRRTAVRLGLVDGQILIGTEGTADVVRPVADLTGAALSVQQSPQTRIAPGDHDLRIRGIRYVELTFRDDVTYRVAVLETDPVAAEIIRRLRRSLPQPQPRRTTPPATPHPKPVEESFLTTAAASPAADVRLWRAAREMHLRVLSEYGAYELEPARYLRYPGVTDIARAPVMDFHTALEEAQALATEAYPDDAGFAGRYRAAVNELRRAWVRCERDGKVTGTSYLNDDDASDLDTAVKLYNHAQATDQAGEKASYLRKVQQILADLDGRGRVQLPAPVVNAIETQVRLALEPGNGCHHP